MKLLCYFRDTTGKEVAPGILVEHPEEAIAYANARAFRNALCEKRGVRVYLQTQELG